MWSKDGTELFYALGNSMMVVPITTDPSLEAGNPSLVFEEQYAFGEGGIGRDFDLSTDGECFLMRKPVDLVGNVPQTDLVAVFNWSEELS